MKRCPHFACMCPAVQLIGNARAYPPGCKCSHRSGSRCSETETSEAVKYTLGDERPHLSCVMQPAYGAWGVSRAHVLPMTALNVLLTSIDRVAEPFRENTWSPCYV